MNKLEKAVSLATKHHGKQKYGSKPYVTHLMAVYKNARKYGGNESELIASWLHDIIEDTSVTKQDISKMFGADIATIVDLVTNQASKTLTFKRISTNRSAVFVKLCDRLANVQSGAKNKKYLKEHPIFRAILYRKGEFDALWKSIDSFLGYVDD